MAVYALITAYIAADQLLSPFILSTIVHLFELLCLVLILWYCYIIIRKRAEFRYRGWALILLILLAINNISIILRGNYAGGLKELMLYKFANDGVPAYILPIIILLLPNRKYFRSILRVLFYSMLLILPIWLINAFDLVQDEFYAEAIGAYLPFYGIILLQFRRRFSVRQQIVMVVIYLVYLLLMILNARRNVVLSLTLYFVLAGFVSCYPLLRSSMRTRILMIGGLFATMAVVFFSWGTLSSTVFDRILDRGFEDSRSGVEARLILDMSSSPASEWVFGRGMDGTYFQITQDQQTYEVSSDREHVETGYLNMLLKGGLVYIALVLLFLFTAFFRGVSFHKPLLTGLSIILILYLIDMYLTNPVSFFAVRTVVFWLIVSVCLQMNYPRSQGNIKKTSRS